MKALSLLVLIAPLGFYACTECPPMDSGVETTSRQQRSFDMWFVENPNQADVTSGVVAQRALYSYHFDSGAARLTELGHRDLNILAEYYRATPGSSLTIVRGDASEQLYAARTATVRDALKQAGVDLDKVTIADGLPNGQGISGQYIIDTNQNQASSSSSGSPTGSGASGQGSTSSTPSSYDSSMKGLSK